MTVYEVQLTWTPSLTHVDFFHTRKVMGTQTNMVQCVRQLEVLCRIAQIQRLLAVPEPEAQLLDRLDALAQSAHHALLLRSAYQAAKDQRVLDQWIDGVGIPLSVKAYQVFYTPIDPAV